MNGKEPEVRMQKTGSSCSLTSSYMMGLIDLAEVSLVFLEWGGGVCTVGPKGG
jgi:hypothetical protein